jgi:hypothetical protein
MLRYVNDLKKAVSLIAVGGEAFGVVGFCRCACTLIENRVSKAQNVGRDLMIGNFEVGKVK